MAAAHIGHVTDIGHTPGSAGAVTVDDDLAKHP
jgi:hypothetical protein